MRVSGSILRQFVIILIILLFPSAESEQEFDTDKFRIIDLLAHAFDLFVKRQLVFGAKSGHDSSQPAGGNFLLQVGEVFVGGICAGEWLLFGSGEQASKFVTSRFHAI